MNSPDPTPAAAPLDDLIEVLNDGINFFGDAADLSKVPLHARQFREVRADMQTIGEALRAAAPLGAPVRQQEGSLIAGLRQGWTDLRARFGDDPDDVYVLALEAQLDRVLDAFESAVAQAAPSPVRDVAREKLPHVRRMHNRLSAMKHAVIDAADTTPLVNYPSSTDAPQE